MMSIPDITFLFIFMKKQKTFLQQVFCQIDENDMIRPLDEVWAGVSGGADSVCLFHALLLYREYLRKENKGTFILRVIHVEHGLRGRASLEDAAFVQAMCAEYGIPCEVVHADVAGLAEKRGLPLEEAGRMERYRIFETVANGERSRIAVAHNMEDQAETVLFNLARGSALTGLGGMRPVRGNVIRPLLGVSRGEIEDFLLSRKIPWRTDATNLGVDYTRNRIRHEILPLLCGQVNAGSVRHICEAAQHTAQVAAYFCRQAEAFLDREAQLQGNKLCLDAYALRKEDPLIRSFVFREAIRRVQKGRELKDVGSVHLKDIEELLWKGSGKRLDLPGRLKCVRSGKNMDFYVGHQPPAGP